MAKPSKPVDKQEGCTKADSIESKMSLETATLSLLSSISFQMY